MCNIQFFFGILWTIIKNFFKYPFRNSLSISKILKDNQIYYNNFFSLRFHLYKLFSFSQKLSKFVDSEFNYVEIKYHNKSKIIKCNNYGELLNYLSIEPIQKFAIVKYNSIVSISHYGNNICHKLLNYVKQNNNFYVTLQFVTNDLTPNDNLFVEKFNAELELEYLFVNIDKFKNKTVDDFLDHVSVSESVSSIK